MPQTAIALVSASGMAFPCPAEAVLETNAKSTNPRSAATCLINFA